MVLEKDFKDATRFICCLNRCTGRDRSSYALQPFHGNRRFFVFDGAHSATLTNELSSDNTQIRVTEVAAGVMILRNAKDYCLQAGNEDNPVEFKEVINPLEDNSCLWMLHVEEETDTPGGLIYQNVMTQTFLTFVEQKQ
jgi:hypothetical protein